MTDRFDRILAVVLLALATVVFFAQARSVYVAPQPNSIRWFGDETWLMLEAEAQITTGVTHYPLALGTPLVERKGMVLGMNWLSSAIYGVPVAIADQDPVSTGRTVTLILSLVLCGVFFAGARVLGTTMSVAAFGVLLLVASRSFLFTSHSARPDMLAGLIVLGVFAYGLRAMQNRERITRNEALLAGAVAAFLMISSSVHLLTLLPGIVLYFGWRLGIFRSWSVAGAFVAGAIAVTVVLCGIYILTTHSASLFASATHAQFHDVVSSIPILRPFSRSVQVANLVTRSKQFAAESPQALLIFAIALIAILKRWSAMSTALIAFGVLLLSWLLLQGAEVHYLMHVVPVMLLIAMIGLSRLIATVRPDVTSLALVVVCGALAFLAIRDSNAAFVEGTRIARSNDRAVAGVFTAIANDWQNLGSPLVLCETPALEGMLRYPVRTMTDHLISFPNYNLPTSAYLDTLGVDYVVLYDSPMYPKDRAAVDPFYQAVRARGTVVDLETGTIGDIGRSYFERSNSRDTLLVIRWPSRSNSQRSR
jgi:hypothetical protein